MQCPASADIFIVRGPTGSTGPPGPSGGGVLVTQTAYVDYEYGDNNTGQVDNMGLPFQSLVQEIFADNSVDLRVVLRPGNYLLPVLDLSGHESITFVGSGPELTTVRMTELSGINVRIYWQNLQLTAVEDQRISLSQESTLDNVDLRSPLYAVGPGQVIIKNSRIQISSAIFTPLQGTEQNLLIKDSRVVSIVSGAENVMLSVRLDNVVVEELKFSNEQEEPTPALMSCQFNECTLRNVTLDTGNVLIMQCRWVGGEISQVTASTEIQRLIGPIFLESQFFHAAFLNIRAADSTPSTTNGLTREGGSIFSLCRLENCSLEFLQSGSSGGVAPGVELPTVGSSGGGVFIGSFVMNCSIGNLSNSQELAVITGNGSPGGPTGRGGNGGVFSLSGTFYNSVLRNSRTGDGGTQGGDGGNLFVFTTIVNSNVVTVRTGNGQSLTSFIPGITFSGKGGNVLDRLNCNNCTFRNIITGNGGDINIPTDTPLEDIGNIFAGDGGYFSANCAIFNTDVHNLTTGNGGSISSIPLGYASNVRIGEGGSVLVNNINDDTNRASSIQMENIITGNAGDNTTAFAAVNVSGGTILDRITSLDVRIINITLGQGSEQAGIFYNSGYLARGENTMHNMESITMLQVNFPANRPNPNYAIVNPNNLVLVRFFIDWGTPVPSGVEPANIPLNINFSKWIGASPLIVTNNPAGGVFNQV